MGGLVYLSHLRGHSEFQECFFLVDKHVIQYQEEIRHGSHSRGKIRYPGASPRSEEDYKLQLRKCHLRRKFNAVRRISRTNRLKLRKVSLLSTIQPEQFYVYVYGDRVLRCKQEC